MRLTTALRATLAAAALAGATLAASQAAAAVTITVYGADQPLPPGQVMIQDFDNPIAPGFTFTQDVNAFVRLGSLGLMSGVSAPPPGDTTMYETVTTNGRATLASSTRLLRQFSLFMGSPDTYNSIRFSGPGGYVETLSGAQLWGPATGAGTGDQSWGRRISYDFSSQGVNKVEFLSSGNSFEFDGLAGLVAGVPETSTWVMMITGFGAIGAMLRRRRMVPARA